MASRVFFSLLWLLLFSFIILNFYAKRTLRPNTVNTLPVLLQPFSPREHILLAQTLWSEGFHDDAKREAKLAQVLGASDQIATQLSLWELEPERLQTAFDEWMNIANQHPDYADAFLMAAIYAYQSGKITEAKRLIQKASLLNPVSAEILQFSAVMR